MNSNSPTTGSAVPGAFAPTRWTLVLRARGESSEARGALSDLCGTYYQPVFQFLRREGRDEDAARELAQEFFARLLARGIAGVDPQRGRFRSYLLGAVKHFLADQRGRECRAKRGGGVAPESLDAGTENSPALQIADEKSAPVDAMFDRMWALAIMERSLKLLAEEFSHDGKAEQFEALKPWLAGDFETMTQAEMASRLDMSESAVKVAIHRLRKRFREIIRGEIAQTVDEPGEVDAELRYLVEVLARGVR